MFNFLVSKSVKNDRLTAKDIIITGNRLKLSVVSDDEVDIYTLPMSAFRNSLWIKKDISNIGIFTDADGTKGMAVFNSSMIDFYYPDENPIQILEVKNGLPSIRFTNLNSNLFLDSEVVCEYSTELSSMSIAAVEYVADNGVVFKFNNKFYSLIF